MLLLFFAAAAPEMIVARKARRLCHARGMRGKGRFYDILLRVRVWKKVARLRLVSQQLHNKRVRLKVHHMGVESVIRAFITFRGGEKVWCRVRLHGTTKPRRQGGSKTDLRIYCSIVVRIVFGDEVSGYRCND